MSNKKEIKIFNHIWHLAHQYSLLKIPNTKWTWLEQPRRKFSDQPRGDMIKDFNIDIVPHYEEGKYDVALLHVDQQCIEKNIENLGKGSLYKELNSVIKDIPKVVIMHGTPYYPEMFSSDIVNADGTIVALPDELNKENKITKFSEDQVGMSSVLINRLRERIGDNFVITNSFKAAKQWGMGFPIWHGLDSKEWFDLPKEPRVVTMISPGGLDKYYDRTFLHAVKEQLAEEENIHLCHMTVDAKFRNWDEYRNFLGRSLVYFNPTRESPMPRSRTEALLSGCCVLTTLNQDSELFIDDGVNGIGVKRNPEFVVKVIKGLFDNYEKAIEIGQRGKEMAKKVFSGDRFQNEWRDMLEAVIENHKVCGNLKEFNKRAYGMDHNERIKEYKEGRHISLLNN